MCDPFTVAMAVLGGGAMLLGNKKQAAPAAQPPAQPQLIMPAPSAAAAREANATVRVGTEENKPTEDVAPDYSPFSARRTKAKGLGGLGRSGLEL